MHSVQGPYVRADQERTRSIDESLYKQQRQFRNEIASAQEFEKIGHAKSNDTAVFVPSMQKRHGALHLLRG